MKAWALVCCLAVPLTAVAGECQVGNISAIRGSDVHLLRNGKNVAPLEGLALCQGDRFSTGASSVVDLHLRDGTAITVGKGSEFVIHAYRYTRRGTSVALFDLLQGALRGVTGLITQHRHRVEVTTAVATIGIRGTTFWGGYGLTPDGAVDVVMLDGHGVYVKTASGQVELDKPGLGTTIRAGADPTAPKTWPDAKLKRALATVTVDDVAPAPAQTAGSGPST